MAVPARPLRRRLSGALGALGTLLVAACSAGAGRRDPSPGGWPRPSSSDVPSGSRASSTASKPAPSQLGEARYALLGEVHDNPAIHRLRLDWLRELTAQRPCVLAMEQLDAERQPQLDEERRREAGPRALAEAGGFSFSGWDWDLYEPVFELALRRGLPLAGVNLSAREASAVARDAAAGQAAQQLRPKGWREGDEAAMAAAIDAGHCGLLPEPAIGAMVRAQLARDRTIAASLAQAWRRHRLTVVLLAGNGHVRTDIGVPRHLPEFDPSGSVFAVGFVEQGRSAHGRFDCTVELPPADRADPCEALRRRFRHSPSG